MPLKVAVGSVAKDFTGGRVSVAGEWKKIKRIEAWDDDAEAWKLAYRSALPLSLTVSPPHVEKIWPPSARVTAYNMTSPAAQATPVEGEPPFTYEWSITGPATLTAPNSAGTSAYKYLKKYQSASGTLTCVCRDSAGQEATASATYLLRID